MSHVEPGTPAAAAGVRAGDLLVEVAGHALSDGDDFRHHLPSRDSDQVVQLRLWRASEVMAPLQRAATLISSISTLRSATKVPPWMPPPPPRSPNCEYSAAPPGSPQPPSPPPRSPPQRAAAPGFTVDDISGAAFPAECASMCASRCSRSESPPYGYRSAAGTLASSPYGTLYRSETSTLASTSPSTTLLRTSPGPGRDLAHQAALEAVGLR